MDDACDRLGVDCRDEARNWVTCEMPMGSVLLLSNLIPHRRLVLCLVVLCVYVWKGGVGCGWMDGGICVYVHCHA